jgi:uncharacterized protein YeaO (DUF488 family)
MPVRIVRLGTRRRSDEGPRLGTVRRPPRGVPKKEYAARDYFDVWLPELAPSAELVSWARAKPMTSTRWNTFARRYRAEMTRPPASRIITLVAAVSSRAALSVGCYCEREEHCHRSVLRELLLEAGAVLGD